MNTRKNPWAPMRAAATVEKFPIRFPVIASPKLDGWRASVQNRTFLTKTLKPLKNASTQSFAPGLIEGLDGELIVGSPVAPDCIQTTTSALSRLLGTPAFTFHLFDYLPPGMPSETPYCERLQELITVFARDNADADATGRQKVCLLLPQQVIPNQAALDEFEEATLQAGFEGVILRDPDAFYKHGKSTPKEQGCLKIKRFVDDEAIIIGWKELRHNDNQAVTDALGHTKRSTSKEGMRLGGVLGAFIARRPDGVEFDIGGGYTAKQREEFWADREQYAGRVIKYKHFPVGVKDKPRHAGFLDFRAAEDML